MEIDRKKEKTLRLGFIIGVWAIFPTTAALVIGRSSTQIADLIKRTLETCALFMSWTFFKKGLTWDEGEHKADFQTIEARIRRFFGYVIIFSAAAIVYVAFHRLFVPKAHGNLIFGIIIASGDFIVNAFFWRKNYILDRQKPSTITEVQWKLYRTKTSVNFFVLASLILTTFLSSAASAIADSAGSLIVASFLAVSGYKMLKEKNGALD